MKMASIMAVIINNVSAFSVAALFLLERLSGGSSPFEPSSLASAPFLRPLRRRAQLYSAKRRRLRRVGPGWQLPWLSILVAAALSSPLAARHCGLIMKAGSASWLTQCVCSWRQRQWQY